MIQDPAPRRPLIAILLFILGVVLPVLYSSAGLPAKGVPQAVRPREPQRILSRQRLTPPLRSGSEWLRFSPDGRYLLTQDPSGVYLFSIDPLKLVSYLEAEDVFRAFFTPDSQAIGIVSYDMRMATRKVENIAELQFESLHVKDGCLSVAISSNGERLACYQLDFSVKVYDLATATELFSEPPDGEFLNEHEIPFPLDTDGIYAGPIGFAMSNSWAPLAGRGRQIVPLLFSPQGRELVVGGQHDARFRIDVRTKKKLNLPGAMKSKMVLSANWLDSDRIVAFDGAKTRIPKIFSLQTGAEQSALAFTADWFSVSSNPRYLLLYERGAAGARVFDIQDNHVLDIPENIGVDICGSVMALLIEDGELYLYHLGDKLPYRMVHVPLGNLPVLRTASVDPSLNLLALALDGQGAVFSTAAGSRTATFPRFVAAHVSEVPSIFLTIPGTTQGPARLVRVDLASGVSSPVSSVGKETLRSGGSVLFEYSFDDSLGMKGMVITREGGVWYKLRALDPASGAEFWKRSFRQETPVPFPDPQGTRLVLGWRARSEEARNVAFRYPAAKQILKKAKLGEHDTFFEVLDARSGKSLGAVLIQVGNHAFSFDAAFSAGDTLFLVKDGIRVSLYSLTDGSLKAKLLGSQPAASTTNNLLALTEAGGKLAIYDTNSGARLDQIRFPEELAYSHFSEDGKRLFVLTRHQVAYVMDLSDIHSPQSSPTPPVH